MADFDLEDQDPFLVRRGTIVHQISEAEREVNEKIKKSALSYFLLEMTVGIVMVMLITLSD